MAKHLQLELFELETYISQPTNTDVFVAQIRERSEEIDYEQLELNLFPKQINTGSFEYLKQAA